MREVYELWDLDFLFDYLLEAWEIKVNCLAFKKGTKGKQESIKKLGWYLVLECNLAGNKAFCIAIFCEYLITR